jgi:glycosyltransferase involved in cell wall biosynthesis
MINFLNYPTIPPISRENLHRPRWSVMIPTNNCSKYLSGTLESLLAQDPGAETMQIEVVDDGSTDDPEKVVEKFGQGRVGFYGQSQNVVHIQNFQTCLARSRGKPIHLLHGDDCLREGFYTKLQKAFQESPNIGAAFCRHTWIDEHSHWQRISPLEMPKSGVLRNWLEKIASGQRIQTPAIVVRREVYEKLGGFDSRLLWSEDWEMWVRIAAHFPVWYEVEPLALYRVHSASNSGRYMQTGENMQDFRRAIEIVRSYLPLHLSQTIANQCLNQNRKTLAYYALGNAQQMIESGNLKAAIAQIQEALRCELSFGIIYSAIFNLSTFGKWWIRHRNH